MFKKKKDVAKLKNSAIKEEDNLEKLDPALIDEFMLILVLLIFCLPLFVLQFIFKDFGEEKNE